MFCELNIDDIEISISEEFAVQLMNLFDQVNDAAKLVIATTLFSEDYEKISSLTNELMEDRPPAKNTKELKKAFRIFLKIAADLNFGIVPTSEVTFRFLNSTPNETGAKVKIDIPRTQAPKRSANALTREISKIGARRRTQEFPK